ncbi:MAG: carboxypeptidase-like regulatory domain-containing protein [Pseudobdellovibrionaceae bacterium]
MKLPKLFRAALFLPLVLTACSKTELQNRSFENGDVGIEGDAANSRQALKVTDTLGQPLAQARVLIGTAENQPFASNFITTDDQGQFKAPAAWTKEESVTIEAKGYVRATFLSQLPKGQSYQLRLSPPAVQMELKGMGTGFKTKDNDNLADFALMMPAVRKSDLFAFDLNMFMSSKTDKISIYGQEILIPSNVSLPKQKEKYGLFPVTLEKPIFRLYFDVLGQHKVATLKGQFPFKQVVGEMQNAKPFVDLINYFSVQSGSLRDVSITQPSQSLDLPVDEIKFDEARTFQSPAFNSQEDFLLAVALNPVNGKYMPTDFKNVLAQTEAKLNTISGSPAELLVVLKKKSEQMIFAGGKLSAAFVAFQNGARPSLLPLIENPHVVSVSEFRVQVPAAPAGIQPVATYSVLSSVQRFGTAPQVTEISTPYWDVYGPNWQSEVKLPEWPGGTFPGGLKRWEVSLVGTQGRQKPFAFSPRILETVTHATHSASDF